MTQQYRTTQNIYNIQSIDYDAVTGCVYGLAPAAGNAIMFKLDQVLNWYFIGTAPYQLQLPPKSHFNSNGNLVYVGYTSYSVNLVTISNTASVVEAPLLAYPSEMITLC